MYSENKNIRRCTIYLIFLLRV